MKKWVYSLATSIILAGAFSSQAAEPTSRESDVVYVIPIRGMIEPALLYVIRRGINESEAAHASALIFVMDTPGGTLNAASEIVRLLQKVTIPTYTFVEKDAFSAGAIIAMSTDHIYMAPGSVIGDAMPIMMTPMGGVQEMPEDLQEKSVSAVAAMIRAAAQESGHDPLLAEKMVRRGLEYKIGDEIISPTNQLLTLTNIEAERKIGKDKRTLLSEGTVGDVRELLTTIDHKDATVKELQVTSAEKTARYIAALAPLFLMAGLLGIYIEIKTPGFGLPGILGILSLALFFWGHHIAGLAGMEEILLFMVGLALVLVEVFIFPGFGFIAFIGLILMVLGLLAAMIQKLPSTSWYPSLPELQIPMFKLALSFILTALSAVVLGKFLPKSNLFSRLVLQQATSRQAGYSASRDTTSLIGKEGIASMPLRPSGSAVFGETPIDVVTRGEFVQRGTRVRVIEAQGHRVVVEPLKES